MKLISSRPLTNHETLQMIQTHQMGGLEQQQLDRIQKIIDHLQTNKYEDIEEIEMIIKHLNQFPLSQTEKIQLINLKPKEMIDIHLILNDDDEKLDLEQKQQILELFI